MKNNTQHHVREGTTFEDDKRWERIAAFRLDDPDAAFPFSRKLARENNWGPAFTSRAIAEYKRFIYLCCISPTGASPSYVTDQVWHMHLLYTQNYWEDFCERTLEMKLHHHPSKGGPPDKALHDAWQQDTRRLYERVFGESPPADIWQDRPPKRTLFTTSFPRIFSLRRLFLLLLFISLIFTGCTAGEGTVYFLFVVLVLTISSFTSKDGKDKKGDSSCSSGSSCGSSCGSGCGGGCGGCGS